MKIKSLKLINFRNYKALKMEPGANINILLGKNASGKTNILESISMLISGKSFRTYRDKEVLRFGQSFFKIQALISKEGLDKDYELVYDIDKKKNMTINLSKVSNLRELRNKSPLVVFMPEDLDIIKDGPQVKRYFFDEVLAICDIIYRLNLQKFKAVLKEKNNQLKYQRPGLDQKILFESYNIQLASLGSYLIARRRSFIEEFQEILRPIHYYISGQEHIKIGYENPHTSHQSIRDIEQGLLEEYRKSMAQDLYRRRSHTGPQRDGYHISLDGLDSRSYASQGQQRSAVLSMKLAQLEIIKKYKKLEPILILDDVFSELDGQRRTKLIDYVKKYQVFISMAEKKYLEEFDQIDVKSYLVEDDSIKIIKRGNNVRKAD